MNRWIIAFLLFPLGICGQSVPMGPVFPVSGGGGAQMTDTFTGTAATLLSAHTADTGQTWTRAFTTTWPSNMQLNGSSKLTNTLGTGPSLYYASLTPSSADYTVSAGATLGTGGADWQMVLGRLTSLSSSTFSGYGCVLVNGTGLELLKWSGSGTNAQIGTTDTAATSGTHTIGIKLAGSTITCYLDGAASVNATGTDSTYTLAGAVGVAQQQLTGDTGYTINSPFTVQ